jgi:hypothetical protein
MRKLILILTIIFLQSCLTSQRTRCETDYELQGIDRSACFTATSILLYEQSTAIKENRSIDMSYLPYFLIRCIQRIEVDKECSKKSYLVPSF